METNNNIFSHFWDFFRQATGKEPVFGDGKGKTAKYSNVQKAVRKKEGETDGKKQTAT